MSTQPEAAGAHSGPPPLAWLTWAWVLIPFLYGLYQLVIKIPALFGG
jgi:hypothetical protein